MLTGFAVNYCNFTSICLAQSTSGMTVFEARGPCKPKPYCIAAYLAAVEPGTYMHCTYNGDALLSDTTFPEMDHPLGAPDGPATEKTPGDGVWTRRFASGTVAVWNENTQTGTVTWGSV